MKADKPTKYIHTMYFIPESKLERADDVNAGADYKTWAKEGLITITEGNDIDLSIVADWFYKLKREYDIMLWKAGYDQKFANEWINGMGKYNWTREDEDLIMILQNAQTLSDATKLVEADLQKRLINYNENKVDRWCLKNASIRVDKDGKCLCIKTKSTMRIDGAVALIILYEMYRRYRSEFRKLIGGKS